MRTISLRCKLKFMTPAQFCRRHYASPLVFLEQPCCFFAAFLLPLGAPPFEPFQLALASASILDLASVNAIFRAGLSDSGGLALEPVFVDSDIERQSFYVGRQLLGCLVEAFVVLHGNVVPVGMSALHSKLPPLEPLDRRVLAGDEVREAVDCRREPLVSYHARAG